MRVCRTEAREAPSLRGPKGRRWPLSPPVKSCPGPSWPHKLQPEQELAQSPWNRSAHSVLAPFPGVPSQGW